MINLSSNKVKYFLLTICLVVLGYGLFDGFITKIVNANTENSALSLNNQTQSQSQKQQQNNDQYQNNTQNQNVTTGNVNVSNSNSNSVSVNAPKVTASPSVQVSVTAPKVVYTVPAELKELPRTGLPLVVWGISALAPLGIKLRKNGKGQQESSSEFSANSIWTERELNKVE
jgi:hypothetical protein